MSSKPLSTQDLDMLLLVRNGKRFLREITHELKLPRSTVQDRLSRLVKEGYLIKEIAFNKRPYQCTEKGINACTVFLYTLRGRKGNGHQKLRAHKVVWYLDIQKCSSDLKANLEKNSFVVSPVNKNWSRFIKHKDDCKIVFNPRKVYVYIDEFYLKHPMEYYEIAIEKVESIKQELEKQFPGLVLGTPRRKMVVASNHIVKKFGPLAMKFHEESMKRGEPVIYHGKKLAIDNSDGDPEEETIDPKTAPADMVFLGKWHDDLIENPIQVADLHQTHLAVGMVKEQLDGLNNQVASHYEEISETARSAAEFNQKAYDDLKKISHKLTDDQQKVLDDLSANAKTLTNISKVILVYGQTLQGNMEMQGKNNQLLSVLIQYHKEFAIAMHEHVVLVQSLQLNAQEMRHGMDSIVKTFADGFNKLIETQVSMVANQTSMVELQKELAKPWYQRLWERIRRDRDGKGNRE